MVEVCVPNIGPRERAKRLGYGVVFAVLSLAGTLVMITTGAPRLTRLFLFLLFWISGSGIFQYLEKT